jgi:putative glutathione S-transferase
MGQLIDGRWEAGDANPKTSDGAFERKESVFRNWVTADGAPGPTGAGGFAAESGRYHLYVSYACPWAHRALIYRAVKGLAAHITVDVVHPFMLDDGWTFDTGFPGTTGDTLLGKRFLREVYLESDPQATTKVTVPVLWDRQTGTIVSNESAEIIRMLGTAFDGITGNALDFRPEALADEIDGLNARIYRGFNNGVYRAGFARTQAAYDTAAEEVFATLDWLEAHLADRRFLTGAAITEADWRLATTLFRFDTAYHGHFKCNRRRIVDCPNLWDYTRALYQYPGVRETVHFDHIAWHYYHSHRTINPTGIVPLGPAIDWDAPSGRAP